MVVVRCWRGARLSDSGWYMTGRTGLDRINWHRHEAQAQAHGRLGPTHHNDKCRLLYGGSGRGFALDVES
jgi:hypothetical protein